MSNLENNPADRNLEKVEDGFDDDLDVPTYRKLADSPETEKRAAEKPATAEPKKRGYDAYAASGRTAPQVIEPGAPGNESDAAATELIGAVPADANDSSDTKDEDAKDRAAHDSDAAAPTEVISAPTPRPDARPRTDAHEESAPTTVMSPQNTYDQEAFSETQVAAPAADFDDDADFRDEEAVETRRGTLDFGLLILRIAVGGLLAVQGLTTFFGWGAAPNTTALGNEFSQQGFMLSTVLGSAIPTIQVIAGVLLVLGLATPLGSALALALSAYLVMFDVASADVNGWQILGRGAEAAQLDLLLFGTALALQFTGPGRLGVDFGRGWARRPLASSWLFCVIAVVVAAAAWYFTAGSWPFVG